MQEYDKACKKIIQFLSEKRDDKICKKAQGWVYKRTFVLKILSIPFKLNLMK